MRPMKLHIITTGGTIDKIYFDAKSDYQVGEPVIGDLLEKMAVGFPFTVESAMRKDSLDMTNQDRLELLATVNHSDHHYILIIHGTDTMDVTAEYLADAELEKSIVLTGAMVPYSIDPVEATANLCSAYGFMSALKEEGIFIAMNGVIGPYDKVKKDRVKGRFSL